MSLGRKPLERSPIFNSFQEIPDSVEARDEYPSYLARMCHSVGASCYYRENIMSQHLSMLVHGLLGLRSVKSPRIHRFHAFDLSFLPGLLGFNPLLHQARLS